MRRAYTRTNRTRLLLAVLFAPLFLLLNAALLLPVGGGVAQAEDLDLGNGYAQRVLLDEDGEAYDLGEVYALPATVAHNAYLTLLERPAPARAVQASGDVPSMIRAAAARNGLDGNRLLRIARCENTLLNPSAVGDHGDSVGIFQFQRALWSQTPYAGYDRTNAWANVEAAAWVMAQPNRPGMGFTPWSCRNA